MAPKKKQEKMALGDFLTNQSLGSWADEMDSVPMPAVPSGYGGARDRDSTSERRAFTQPSWETARQDRAPSGMGARGASYDRPRFDREAVPFPTKPPYTAHLGNLAYDVSSTEIEKFLSDCEVTTVRIMEDKVDRKPKGFGYVEFATPEGLRSALAKSESNFMGRNVKISVADPPRDRPDSTRDFSDWSRKGPLPDLPQNTRQLSNRGFSRGGPDSAADAGSERGGPPNRRQGFFEDDGKVRDLSNWERKGPLSPAPATGQPVRDGGRIREGGPRGEVRPAASWGEARSDAGSRPPRREFEPRPQAERAPTAAEQDNQWRSKMRPDPSPAATPDMSIPNSPVQPEALKERPKLNLTKRTVSTAEGDTATSAAGDAKASPFGAARPIDTATREREVEERRELALRQKKGADDKAKEDKASNEASGKPMRFERPDHVQGDESEKSAPAASSERVWDRGSRAPRQQQQNGNRGQPKENGEAAQGMPDSGTLQRDGEEHEEAAQADMPDAPANGKIVDDKHVKPMELVVPADGPGAKDTAEVLDNDGWATVPAKNKNNRRGGGRAVAS